MMMMHKNEFYEGVKPILIYSRLSGMLPISLTSNGPKFRILSWPMLYSIAYWGFLVTSAYFYFPDFVGK